MKKQDIASKKDGKTQLRRVFWGDDEVEEIAGRAYPYDAHFDLTAPCDDVQPFMIVI